MSEDMSPAAKRLSPMMSSADQTWNTPRWFIDRVERALGPIGLDPCSNASSVVRAAVEFRLDRGEDGLALPWHGFGLVFVNPPFGREIGAWTQRCARVGSEVVALVPARCDTAWFHDAAHTCDALILWRGRFAFRVRDTDRGNAPFPSAVFYWGARRAMFLREFAADGFIAKARPAT
jgi:DNA N-6-adenine-methyltransferase Dam